MGAMMVRPQTKKVTINLGYVDLGQIDLLVHEGFYSNRTDFIRTAIRNQISTHADAVRTSIRRHTFELGLRHYGQWMDRGLSCPAEVRQSIFMLEVVNPGDQNRGAGEPSIL